MRIDSFTYTNASLAGIRDSQAHISRLSQQISTGEKYLATKDNPLAAEKILKLTESIATHNQFAENQAKAEMTLKYESTIISHIDKTLRDARALIVNQSPTLSNSSRELQALQLRAVNNQILSLVNTRDSSGNYIFSGENVTTEPYANPLDGTETATTYAGSPLVPAATSPDGRTAPGGARWVEADVGRYIQINDNLDSVIQSGVAGADLFQVLDEAGATLDDDPSVAPFEPTQAQINGWIEVIDAALVNLDRLAFRSAAALSEVKDMSATTQSLLTIEQNALSEMVQVDKAAAIIQLQNHQTTLQAAEQAYAKTAGLTLFDYL